MERTRFLPAERSSPEEIRRERAIVEAIPLLCETLEAMPQFAMILNERRQILFANRAVTQSLGKPLDQIAGQRTGEALGCIRSKLESGCGTTEYCGVCGAGRTMLSLLKGAQSDERECRMLVEAPKADLDLLVRATALSFDGLNFTLYVAEDRSGETRRRLLERLFFHDALNTAGAVNGIAELLPEVESDDIPRYCQLLQTSSEQLLEQILSQRDMTMVEVGEYALKPSPCPLTPFLEAMASLVSAHPAALGRLIRVAPHPADLSIVTDRGLLMRVVGNMLKNAVEAEPKGAAVLLGCGARAGGGVDIWVRNPTAMPREVQLQLFQRAFSTKGADRGLGTYSMRLLGERYLGGSVSFRSDPQRGTEFRVALPPAAAVAAPPSSKLSL